MTNPEPEIDFEQLLPQLDDAAAEAAAFAEKHYAAVRAASPEDRQQVLDEWREEATAVSEGVLLITAAIADWIDAEAEGMAAEAIAAAQPPPARLLPGAAEHAAATFEETWTARPPAATESGPPTGDGGTGGATYHGGTGA